jgi:hypothetical protein
MASGLDRREAMASKLSQRKAMASGLYQRKAMRAGSIDERRWRAGSINEAGSVNEKAVAAELDRPRRWRMNATEAGGGRDLDQERVVASDPAAGTVTTAPTTRPSDESGVLMGRLTGRILAPPQAPFVPSSRAGAGGWPRRSRREEVSDLGLGWTPGGASKGPGHLDVPVPGRRRDRRGRPRASCAARALRLRRGIAPVAQAIGSFLASGRLSQRLPAATMQLIPVGVVLTTVQVPFSSEE